jgi:membrane protein DedA with SNARE-associated domain
VEAVTGFADWMASLPPVWIYLVTFAIAYGENVVPPVPGDVAIVVAGSLVALGAVSFLPTLLLAVVGSTLGFLTMYAVGRRLGEAIHDPLRLRWIPRAPVRRVDAWFERWGLGVVALNRFLSGGRAVIALVSGGPVAAWSLASAAVWCALLVGGGYAVGSEWDRVLGVLRVYGRVVTVVLGIVAVVAVATAWHRRRRRQETAKTPPGVSPPSSAR